MMKKRFEIYSFVLLILLSVLSLTWYLYENHLADAKNRGLNEAEMSLSASRAQLARDKAATKSVQTNLNQVKQVPKNRDESNVIRELNQFAGQSGIKVLSVNMNSDNGNQNNAAKPSASGQNSGNVIDLQFSASGSIKQLLDFVDKVQSDSRLVLVKDYNVSSQSAQTQSQTQLSAEFDFPYRAQG